MRFVSLEGYPTFFQDMRAGFPIPVSRGAGLLVPHAQARGDLLPHRMELERAAGLLWKEQPCYRVELKGSLPNTDTWART